MQWKSGTEEYDAARQADVTDRAHTIDGLTGGVDYTIRVLAHNINGDGAISEVTETAEENIAPPALSLALSQPSITEKGVATVTASLDRPSGKPTTVSVAVTPVSPARGSDVELSANTTLTIERGETTSTGIVTIGATDNGVDAPDKTFQVSATAENAHGVTAPPAVTLTILDDDERGVTVLPPTLWVPQITGATYSVVLDSSPNQTVTVTASVTGAAGVTVRPDVLSFDASNWYRRQTVTVRAGAASTVGDTGTISHAVSGGEYEDHAVTAGPVGFLVREPPPEADARLSALAPDAGRLSPPFDRARTTYTASVGYTVTRITLDRTTSATGATVAFLRANGSRLTDADGASDGFQANLAVGENVIRVRVTAQNGVTTRTYTITVTRTAEDPSLSPPARDPAAPFASAATYTTRFEGRWTTAVTPDGLPGGAHFSPLIGGVHGEGATFLESGEAASAGVESMAEVGGTSTLQGEVGAAVNASPPTALGVLVRSSNIGPTGTGAMTDVELTTAFPRVTLTTMIAPSHDWFVGVSGLPLLDASGRWLRSHQVNLFPWDAGTEEGTDFALGPSVDTSPRGVIHSIRGTGPFTTGRIASLSFALQSLETARSVAENTPGGATIGPPVAPAATSGTVEHTLGGADGASFDIDAPSGQLRTKAGVLYDHEARDGYTVTVTAEDPDGSIVTTVDITVTDVDEPPDVTGRAHVTIAENSGTDVESYVATDPEGEGTSWIALAGGDSGHFELTDGGDLHFTSVPDFEAKADANRDNTYELTLQARDASGKTGTLDVTVTVRDVNEPPVISGPSGPIDFEEHRGADITTFTATDPESATLLWSLSGDDRERFALANRVLSFKVPPDFEAPADAGRDNLYHVTVEASDGHDAGTPGRDGEGHQQGRGRRAQPLLAPAPHRHSPDGRA